MLFSDFLSFSDEKPVLDFFFFFHGDKHHNNVV